MIIHDEIYDITKNKDTILDGLSFFSSSQWCFFRGLFGKHIPDRMDLWKKTHVSWFFAISTTVGSSLVHDSRFFFFLKRQMQTSTTDMYRIYSIYTYKYLYSNFIDVLFIVRVCVSYVVCRDDIHFFARWCRVFCVICVSASLESCGLFPKGSLGVSVSAQE